MIHYYKNKYPRKNDVTFVTIKNLEKSGIYCNLIEYNNLEGLILSTELDRKTRRNTKVLHKIADPSKFQHGTVYPVLVVDVTIDTNPDTGEEILKHIDLSYKKNAIDIREELIQNFKYIEKIRTIVDEISYFTKLDKQLVYEHTMWKFAFDGCNAEQMYVNFLKHPNELIEAFGDDYSTELSEFLDNFNSRITYTKMKVEQSFSLSVYAPNALQKIKDILQYDNEDIVVSCTSSPQYKISTTGYSLDKCNEHIQLCFDELKQKSLEYKSKMVLLPRIDNDGIVQQQSLFMKSLNMYT